MTAPTVVAPTARPARRQPALVRNAAALMTSTVTSAALTFGFWVVAARWFAVDTVGKVSAIASAMALLAALAQLNLVSLYARFLPRAGTRTRSLIVSGYGASAATSLVLTAGFFLLGLSSGPVENGPLARLLFAGAVIASAIFFIQGSVLTALGRAMWVPAVNGLTAAVRLALLPVLASAGAAAEDAVLSAWALPIVASTLAVTWWVVARGAPAHARSHTAAPPAGRREVLGFASAEYVNGMLSNAVAFLPPVVVAATLGAEPAAYFYVPWLVGVCAITLLWNVVTSFVVAASREGSRAPAHLQRLVGLVLAVVVAGGLVLCLVPDRLLELLGPAYATHGATPLRLVGLSLPFAGIVLLFSAFSVMEKRMWRLVAVQSAGATMLFAGCWFGLSRIGIAAPAAALLVAQAAMALAVLPALVRKYRETRTADRSPQWAKEAAWSAS